VTFTY